MRKTKPNGEQYVPHLNMNEDVLAAFNRGQWWRIDRLTNADFDAHFLGEKTYYFTGGKGRRVLVLIDVDCKRSGTPEGAKAFCDFLSKSVFPNLYHEPSTNGRGRHGYFLLETFGLETAYFNGVLLQRLAPYLNHLAEDFDVEFVEIKGTSPCLVWGEQPGRLDDYKCGTLGKLPREVSRFSEWQNTTVVSVRMLEQLPDVRPHKASNNSGCSPCGSLTGSVVKLHDLEDLPDCLKVAEPMLDGRALNTTGRHVVTAEDLGIFLLLGRCFTNNMNKDGTMPRARFEANWSQLYRDGRVSRPFCRKRFKVIRDFLSSRGLLDWEDHTYMVSTVLNMSGRGTNGRACKWRFSVTLMEMLSPADASPSADVGEEEASWVAQGAGAVRSSSFDHEGGGEASWVAQSAHTEIPDLKTPLERLSEATFPVPVQVFDTFDYLLAAQRIDKIITSWTPDNLIAA
jgi:hypothetical protein